MRIPLLTLFLLAFVGASALACAELDSTGFNFGHWFFTGNSELPPWTGYTLGFRLVQDYLDRNPGTSAASLVQTPAELFRP